MLLLMTKKRLDCGVSSCPYNNDNDDYEDDCYNNDDECNNSKIQIVRRSIELISSMFIKFSNHNDNEEDNSLLEGCCSSSSFILDACLCHSNKCSQNIEEEEEITKNDNKIDIEIDTFLNKLSELAADGRFPNAVTQGDKNSLPKPSMNPINEIEFDAKYR